MVEIYILKDLAIIFALSVVSLFICHRLKLPPIVGFLLAGLLVGPYGLGLIKSVHEVDILAEIGIVLLLFTIGIEFSLKDLLKSKKAVLLGGALQVVVTILVVYVIAGRFGFAPTKAVFIGFLIALSSTAIVLRTLQDRNELHSAHGRAILSILIFQDIIIVPMMIFVPLLSGEVVNPVSSLLVLGGKGIAVVVIVVVLARYLVPRVLYQVARTQSRELFLLTTALICIAVAWSTNQMGLSLGLGAFLAGLIISDSEFSLQALEGILPFKIIFTSFFFVSIGMLLNLSQFAANLEIALGWVLGVIVIKTILMIAVALILGLSSRAAIIAGLALSQVGEFSFILSKVGLSANLINQNTYQVFLAVAIITMALTPFIINLSPRVAEITAGWSLLRRFRTGSYRRLTDGREMSRRDRHLVIIGFGVNGRNLALAARSADIPYVIIEMNPDTVLEMRDKGEPIYYGDATGREVLHHVGIEKASIAVVAISDPIGARRITRQLRQLNPGLYIIVRTRFVSEMKALYDQGADEVIPEEFETSMEIFARVLTKYLIPRGEIERLINELRSHSYEMFRGLSAKSSTLDDLRTHIPDIEINAVKLDADSPLVDSTLEKSQLRNRYGVNVLAIARNEELIANPGGSQDLRENDILYIIGSHQSCANATIGISGLEK